MQAFFETFFKNENIECFSSLPVGKMQSREIVSPRRLPEFSKTCIVFLIPYFVKDAGTRNISLYAASRDYHHYVKQLESRFLTYAAENNADIKANFFADTSPFSERKLALRCKLGFPGCNGLVINPVYGSYVFIGELVTDAEISVCSGTTEITGCLGCGKCRTACPSQCFSASPHECMSQITQKKQITETEAGLIKNHPLVWGCDICQEVCPHNTAAKQTPISFFHESRIPRLSTQTLSGMSEKEFLLRAYSWRGRNVISRNISLHEQHSK